MKKKRERRAAMISCRNLTALVSFLRRFESSCDSSRRRACLHSRCTAARLYVGFWHSNSGRLRLSLQRESEVLRTSCPPSRNGVIDPAAVFRSIEIIEAEGHVSVKPPHGLRNLSVLPSGLSLGRAD